MTPAPTAPFNASDHDPTKTRACEHCRGPFVALRKWAKFCGARCRKADFDEKLRKQHIREYLREIGRKGAAVTNARNAKRKAA